MIYTNYNIFNIIEDKNIISDKNVLKLVDNEFPEVKEIKENLLIINPIKFPKSNINYYNQRNIKLYLIFDLNNNLKNTEIYNNCELTKYDSILCINISYPYRKDISIGWFIELSNDLSSHIITNSYLYKENNNIIQEYHLLLSLHKDDLPSNILKYTNIDNIIGYDEEVEEKDFSVDNVVTTFKTTKHVSGLIENINI